MIFPGLLSTPTMMPTAAPGAVVQFSDPAIVSIYMTNCNDTPAKVQIFINTGNVASMACAKEFNTTIGANGARERTGIPVSAGESVFAKASIDNVAIQVRGVPAQ